MAERPKRDPDNVVPFRKPVKPREPMRLPSWVPKELVSTVTGWIVLANLFVWIAMIVVSRGAGVLSRFDPETTFAFGSLVPELIAIQPWRMLSSTFVHADIGHIAMNMAILWFTGRQLERAYGSGRFAALYLVACLTGSLFSLVWHLTASPGTSVGASGGVLGVVAALAAFFWRATGRHSPHTKQWLWFCGLGLVGGLIMSSFGMAVDNAAHLGGMTGGFLLSYYVFAGSPSWKPLLSRIATGVVIGGGLASVGASIATSPSLDELAAQSAPEGPGPRGVAALSTGDYETAEKELAAAIAEEPDQPMLRMFHAAALAKLGRDDEAMRDLAIAEARLASMRKQAPSDAGIAATHAKVLLLLGRKEEASSALTAALNGQAAHGGIYGEIAEALYELGRLEEARRAAAKARMTDRGNPRWKELHEKIGEELANPAPSPT